MYANQVKSKNPYPIRLKIRKWLLLKVNSYPELSGFRNSDVGYLYNLTRSNSSQEAYYNYYYYGINNNCFKTVKERVNFKAAYNKLLGDFEIPHIHNDEILYLSTYFDVDFERQSLQNSTVNRLNNAVHFLSDFIINSVTEFDKLKECYEYQMIHDIHNKLIKFIKKKYITETDTPEELISIGSIKGDPSAVIVFRAYTIFNHEIAVPIQFVYQITSTNVLTNSLSQKINQIPIPSEYQHDIQELLINGMTAELEAHKHPFYRLMCKKSVSIEKLMELYKQRKEKTVTKHKAIMFVSKLLINYFQDHRLYENKVQMSDFLFRYFALLKVFNNSTDYPLPFDHNELANYYRMHKIMSAEKFRLQLVEETR